MCKTGIELQKQNPKIGPRKRNKRKSVIESDDSFEKQTSFQEKSISETIDHQNNTDPKNTSLQEIDNEPEVEVTGVDKVLVKRESDDFHEKDINPGLMNVSDDEPEQKRIKKEAESLKTS